MFFKFFSRQISRTFKDSPVYSSTFQACANPVGRSRIQNEGFMTSLHVVIRGLLIGVSDLSGLPITVYYNFISES